MQCLHRLVPNPWHFLEQALAIPFPFLVGNYLGFTVALLRFIMGRVRVHTFIQRVEW